MSDICLILEGTYPYVTGGVSSCVYQLIKNTPQFEYTILYIGGGFERYEEYKYPVPENVKNIQEFYLFEYDLFPDKDLIQVGDQVDVDLLKRFYTGKPEVRASLFEKVFFNLLKPHDLSWDPLVVLRSLEVWEMLEELYHEHFKGHDGPSFIDFFYTWRFTHYPIVRALDISFPLAKVYHSLSTGYAGLIGAAASLQFNAPFILTEHGIYSHEREIEIYNANWIHSDFDDFQARKQLSVFKEWWIHLFHFMGNFAYHRANSITTLFQGNAEKQIKYGADEAKIEIIPNGIDVDYFGNLAPVERTDFEKGKVIISMVGRVVPIKDVKSFIKAISSLKKKSQEILVYIIGPYEEDPEYYRECLELVKFYGLEEDVLFTGKQNVKDYYPKTDILVLSSISEGQPMVILEAFSAGIPVVTTDVGSCRELIFGQPAEDDQFGRAGSVVPFGEPGLLSDALFELVSEPQKRKEYGINAKNRVQTFYTEKLNISRYENLYHRFLEGVG